LNIGTHYTDTGGASDHVFILCAMLGFRFCPRLRDLSDRRLACIEPASTYSDLQPLLGQRVKADVVREHWDEAIRLIVSLKAGTVAPSIMLKKLAAYRRQNQLDLALQELGRIERTLFIYVTWNLFGPDVTLGGRRHGEHCAAGRALAGPCRRASCTRMARHSVGPWSRSAYARRILAGPFRISGVLRSGVDRSVDRRTRSRRSVRA
jgi:hypothetical protein